MKGEKQDQAFSEVQERVLRVVEQGTTAFYAMKTEDGIVSREEWKCRFGEARDPNGGFWTDPFEDALWTFLVSDPEMGRLRTEWLETVDESLKAVLPKGTTLYVQIAGLPASAWPEVVLDEQLGMQRGKSGRLECSKVKGRLILTGLSVLSVGEEANTFRVQDDCVELLGKGEVQVKVVSLNQAYTFASRRLEPNRMSHTGRIYSKMYLTRDEFGGCSLDRVRAEVDAGRAKFVFGGGLCR